MDGLGRTIKVEKGTGPLNNQVTLSVQESVYGPCACTPLGKVFKVSQPHAPGATPAWTVYTYDALGRTLTMTKPDNSVTSYQYSGNWSSAYDAAGNYKSFMTDGLGNLVQVVDANGTAQTFYTYNAMNKLIQVQMTRNGTTQTRTFNYDQGGQGVMLLSAVNPENGTVTYTYNADATLATRRDAKNQTVNYSYDGYKGLTQVSRPDGTQDNYSYDTQPYGASINTAGRLAAVTFTGRPDPNTGGGTNFANVYAYTAAGRSATRPW
jgi:YD repeat-containing protein